MDLESFCLYMAAACVVLALVVLAVGLVLG